MNCNYCEESSNHHHEHYDISNVKTRFIPTYYHTPIFSERGKGPFHVRCTPTFHSTAMNVEGYQPSANQHIKINEERRFQQDRVVYRNDSLQKKQRMLNPDHPQFCAGFKKGWYDPAKQQLFSSLRCCTARYSRQRKLADLSSSQVFGGAVTMQLCCSTRPAKQKTDVERRECCQHIQNTDLNPQEYAAAGHAIQHQQNQQPQQPHIPAKEEQKGGQGLVYNQKISPNSNKLEKGQLNNQKQNGQITQKYSLNKTKQQILQPKYKIAQQVRFGKRHNSAGRKIKKIIALGEQVPKYTVSWKKRA